MNSTLNKIKRRIEKGWDIHTRDEYALRDACKKGNLPLVQLLVEHFADIHALDNAPLKMACANNHIVIAHFLLERGANPRGMAWRACGKKNFELAKLFVAFGDPMLSQALDITCSFRKGNLEMAKFLLERGAMFRSDPVNLHNAISNSNLELVKLVLAVGGVVPTPCALALAIKQCKDENTERFEIVRLLFENLDIPCRNSCCTQYVVKFLADCGIHDVCKSQSVEDVSWWLSSTYVQKVMKFFIEQRGNEWIQRVSAVELCNASTISEIGFWNMM
jgi:hypothetical protein